MEIITRKEALERGLKSYFTGKPCKHRHIAKRSVCDSGCFECQVIKNAKQYRANPSKRAKKKAYNKEYHAANRPRIRKRKAEYHIAHKERINEQSRQWRLDNPERFRERVKACHARVPEKRRAKSLRYRKANLENCRATSRTYYAAYPEKALARCRLRQARKRQLTPSSLTKEHNAEMVELYLYARLLSIAHGSGFHVHHKQPLSKGGLHEPSNLEILTAFDNLSKGNRTK